MTTTATETGLDELDAILARARSAFDVARHASDEERAGWIERVAADVDAAVDELVAVADEETHLGPVRLRGEVARTTGQLRLFARVVREGSYLEVIVDHADASATPPRPDLRRMLVPLGPVAVYAASNFPFAFSVLGGDTASALAVGCPVVVKAHPGHPRLSRRTAEIATTALREAGAPEGYLALVEGYDAGIALIEHPLVAAASFTGSVAGGRALFDRAAARPDPIPFFGELGSVNPVVVTPAADSARGAELAAGLAASFTSGFGQFCTKPGVVFVPPASTIERELAEAPLEAGRGPLLTDSILRGYLAGTRRLVGVPDVDVVAGGLGEGPEAAPLVVAVDAPTAAEHAGELLEEVFGPVTLLVRYRDDAELASTLERIRGSLTATVHAEPEDDVRELVDRLTRLAGRVLFSGWPTGVAVTWAQHHGGPWPSTTSQHTSVGTTAARRFQRPVVYQDAPAAVLPAALREDNPLGIPRRVDGVLEIPGV